MKKSAWTKQLWTFDHINQFAQVRTDLTSAVDFLKSIQVIPYDVKSMPAPNYIVTRLDPQSIPAGYLASLAFEWDADGPSSPSEFVDALRPELKGSPEREVVREQLETAGKENG